MKCDLTTAEVKAMQIAKNQRYREQLSLLWPTGIIPPWIEKWARDEADAWLANELGERQEVLAL